MKDAFLLLACCVTAACGSSSPDDTEGAPQAFGSYPSAIDFYHCSASISVNGASPVALPVHSGTDISIDERDDHNAQHLNTVDLGFQTADLTPALPHYLDALSPQLHPNPVTYHLFGSESVVVKRPAAQLEIESLFRSEFSVVLPARYNAPGLSNAFSIVRAEDGKTLSYTLLYSEPAAGVDTFRMEGSCVRVQKVRNHTEVAL